MLTEERHSFILKRLQEDGVVKTQELMKLMNCSESTVRRDLAQLEKENLLKRVHGGAKRVYQLDEELSDLEKSSKNVQEKLAIGKLAASLVEENDVIFLDAGTTTLNMIDFLNKNITVVTNGVMHASLLADKQIQTYLVGGRLKPSTKAIIGATSLRELSNYRFNKAFLGMNGIDLEYGYTTPDPEEAALKQTVQMQSATTYVVADASKWNKVTFSKVCDIEEANIITNEANINFKPYQEKTNILEAKQ